ncbi:hypothetical protein O6H91_11G088500 [Diphasiastrum complanatum]|uniref:Uncharacterized protein n=1 Tax=Diphasiastrum complanatum TaxID=34168 RepID=A0ACC2CBE8_DIPCM|nr:hypothetical protein O6H91_11G088500 [Diphasiastrum complanatum]
MVSLATLPWLWMSQFPELCSEIRSSNVVAQMCMEVSSSSNGHPTDLHFDLMGSPFTKCKSKMIVKTESGVKREKLTKPDPPCVVCGGTGKTDCFMCDGRGVRIARAVV